MKRNPDILQQKQDMRAAMLLRLKNQPESDKIAKARRVKDLALNSFFFKKSRVVMLYAATAQEVDTKELIQETLKSGRTAALPSVDLKRKEMFPVRLTAMGSLVKGAYGIWEPPRSKKNILSLSDLDLVFVPGMAFDKWGNRLGRGLGYYDRFLCKLAAKTIKIGLAFDFQMLDGIPAVKGEDAVLDLVISN